MFRMTTADYDSKDIRTFAHASFFGSSGHQGIDVQLDDPPIEMRTMSADEADEHWNYGDLPRFFDVVISIGKGSETIEEKKKKVVLHAKAFFSCKTNPLNTIGQVLQTLVILSDLHKNDDEFADIRFICEDENNSDQLITHYQASACQAYIIEKAIRRLCLLLRDSNRTITINKEDFEKLKQLTPRDDVERGGLKPYFYILDDFVKKQKIELTETDEPNNRHSNVAYF